MKRLLLVLGAIAMVACFSAVGHGLTLSSTMAVDQRELVRLVIALGIPIAIGLTRGRLGVPDSVIAIGSTGFALFTLSPWLVDLVIHGPGGGRALVIVTTLSLAIGIIGLVQALRAAKQPAIAAPAAPAIAPPA